MEICNMLYHWISTAFLAFSQLFIINISIDAGGVVAAEGAKYTAPSNIPYKFNMAGSVRGYHKVLSVTSEHDKLKLEPLGDKTTSVSILFHNKERLSTGAIIHADQDELCDVISANILIPWFLSL